MTLPEIHSIEKVSFPKPEEVILRNGIRLYGFNGTKNDILRIDLAFNSGRWNEPAKLVADSTAHLFKSGTARMTSFELSEKIDTYGSTIKASSGYHTFNVSLYCMNRFLEPSLQLLKTCLTEIIFPQNEIDLFQKNSISKLKVRQEKNDYLADVAFKKAIYGDMHPYGYETTGQDIKNISQPVLQKFYAADLKPENCTMFIAGKYADEEIRLINEYLGKWETDIQGSIVNRNWEEHVNEENKIKIHKEKSVQASIVIGKKLFNKHHEDYAAFSLLNTVFGGYFSSRLMSNIREEKGLTYGIYSGLNTFRNSGTFSIHTDTNVESLELCLREIYSEIDRLQNELIPEDEISLAKNYLLGKFLDKTDGPFHQIEVFKSYFLERVDIHKFEEFEETISQTDAVSLQRLAQKYLLKESMCEVVVG
ncbi:MAG: peptidase [Bacteroidota bacterium]|nr:peptidase [Bacteroidota bacterium]